MRITSTNNTNGKKITVNKNYDKWQLQCTAIWRTAHAAAVILGFNYEVHNALATNSTILQRTFQQPVSIYQCLWPNLYSACTATAIYEKKTPTVKLNSATLNSGITVSEANGTLSQAAEFVVLPRKSAEPNNCGFCGITLPHSDILWYLPF